MVIQEQPVDIALNYLLQQDKGLLPFLAGRNLHNPGKHGRHLHGGKFQFFLFVPLLVEEGGNIQGFIADQWKRPGSVHRHRGQHRVYRFLKITVYILPLGFA